MPNTTQIPLEATQKPAEAPKGVIVGNLTLDLETLALIHAIFMDKKESQNE